ncbi:hypothetical protein L9F63_009139, partial [Diploptera punctata]
FSELIVFSVHVIYPASSLHGTGSATKSIHAVIIVKLPDKMSDLEDFDHVFDV